ncbi:hypothetical protein [Desulforamulus putei]|uniref:Uncharacterized protein n=1 Tax=Desulforamulus putei DSM 12395 TaxID=1121429 RepID=A0A1M4ZXD9_9FIRM|nr:hypothetical protein [Desulforamulus putei]SHF22296.1 hypothetical protein SAMN02745133_02103 [Desulforamulus putei DSM 12395]
MYGTSKCGKCANKETCEIRMNLSKIIKEAIKNAETEVKRLAPREIDYMILTDISVIPTRCQNYVSLDGVKEEQSERESLFFLGRTLAPTAI